jgi:hypothetical protein
MNASGPGSNVSLFLLPTLSFHTQPDRLPLPTAVYPGSNSLVYARGGPYVYVQGLGSSVVAAAAYNDPHFPHF